MSIRKSSNWYDRLSNLNLPQVCRKTVYEEGKNFELRISNCGFIAECRI